MMLLVDSDWIIQGLNNAPEATALLARLSVLGLSVSTISVGEVLEGAFHGNDPPKRIAETRAFRTGFQTLPVTEDIATEFANCRAQLRRQGNLIPDLDLLIAATAIAHDLTLLTRNRRHFERVPGLRLYDDGQRSFGTTPSE